MVGPYLVPPAGRKTHHTKHFVHFTRKKNLMIQTNNRDVRKFVFLKKVTVDKLKDLLLTLLLSSNSPVAMETFCVTYLSFH